MKQKSKGKRAEHKFLFLFIFAFLCFWGCSDNNSSDAYDPGKPIQIVSFSPESGSARTQILIRGENFGSDASRIKVEIGGISARVIGVNNGIIYCMVPPLAYDGVIEVTIEDTEGKAQTVVADKTFEYIRKSMVTTIAGYVSETGEYKVEDGPFDNAGFGSIVWMSVDPQNSNHIYMIEERASIRLLDLVNEEVSTVISIGQMNITNPRTISWTPEGDMVLSNDQPNADGISSVRLKREDGFMRAEVMTNTQSCNGMDIHPVTGEYYLTQWNGSVVYRFDPASDEKPAPIFSLSTGSFSTFVVFHPEGRYAYFIAEDMNYIMKSIYNWEQRTLGVPSIFVGSPHGAGDWLDGAGTSARFYYPHQGIFAKNDAYVEAGLTDVYDFYVCDRWGNCIRKITPEGIVTTLAGRGSPGLDDRAFGYVDGDLRKEARFREPYGIVFKEDEAKFFVSDKENHRIRGIIIEEGTK
ncbi:MAG: IPT/TIG domain-containing protein [Dysgonomonas sp.]|nr:IPT/TIG domain-containing protein [Dysgonomonas sp.]